MVPVLSKVKLVLSPDVAKYNGIKMHTTRSSILLAKWCPSVRGTMRPTRNPPKISEMPMIWQNQAETSTSARVAQT
jgi:hypothetical protein